MRRHFDRWAPWIAVGAYTLLLAELLTLLALIAIRGLP